MVFANILSLTKIVVWAGQIWRIGYQLRLWGRPLWATLVRHPGRPPTILGGLRAPSDGRLACRVGARVGATLAWQHGHWAPPLGHTLNMITT